ncbi:MAG: DUF2239 family protein [Nitrospiraceae bacterium]|nr:DUF2239 family protein [Nitrospiraceae bacterium]
MSPTSTCTAFVGDRLLAKGLQQDVALAVKQALDAGEDAAILIFDDDSGRLADFDLRGSSADITARLTKSDTVEPPRSSGRPKLGVVAREVTLLPRHWDWLSQQPGGASASLRRLVEAGRKNDAEAPSPRAAQQAADRFMMAMLGDQPGYEEAARALYAGDAARFLALTEAWPHDLRDHARSLAAPSFKTER